jgi:hypothetical protein
VRRENQPDLAGAICRGVDWLIGTTDRGRVTEPSPIGFYFAKLWYFEKLYPLNLLGRGAVAVMAVLLWSSDSSAVPAIRTEWAVTVGVRYPRAIALRQAITTTPMMKASVSGQ